MMLKAKKCWCFGSKTLQRSPQKMYCIFRSFVAERYGTNNEDSRELYGKFMKNDKNFEFFGYFKVNFKHF